MLVHTLPGTLRALLRVLVFSTASGAFQVSPSSPCSSQCTTDGAVNTDTSEIVCSDADFSTTSSGLKFRDCIQCLQTSRYSLGNESDVDWFFYNLRFAVDVCLFKYPDAESRNETSACKADYLCNPLQNALEADGFNTIAGNAFDYCTADGSAFRGQSRETCIGCLQDSPSNKYLSNFLIALEAGCDQKQVTGQALSVNRRSLFSQNAVNILTAEAAANATATGQDASPKHLSVGAIAGIAVGAAALFLIGVVLLLLYYRRQRRYDKEDRARRASYASYLGYPTYPLYPGENTEIALQGPSYTVDYKTATQDHQQVASGGSETSGDKASGGPWLAQVPSHRRHLSREESQTLPSAMPIHPAYVPRAMMRRNSPAVTTPSQFSSDQQQSRNPSFDSPPPLVLSAPPPARRPSRARVTDSGSVQASADSTSDSTGSATSFAQRRGRQVPSPSAFNNPALEADMHHTAVLQLHQHGIYAGDRQASPYRQQQQRGHEETYQSSPQYQQVQQQHPSPHLQQLASSFAADPGSATTGRTRASSTSSSQTSPNLIQPVPLRGSRSRSGRSSQHATLSLSSSNSNQSTTTPRSLQQQQQQRTPPFQVKRSDAPLCGLEDMEISGPLAFPDDHHRFRERRPAGPETAGSGSVGHGTVGPGAARFAARGGGGGGGGDEAGTVEQRFIRKGWVAEVPLAADKDDLW